MRAMLVVETLMISQCVVEKVVNKRPGFALVQLINTSRLSLIRDF